MSEIIKVPRAKTYEDLSRKKFKEIILPEDWKPHLGVPQLGDSSWAIRGESGQGKTSYALQLAKAIAEKQKIHYNTLEEGTKKSFQMALQRENIKLIKSRFTYEKESVKQLIARLDRNRQPRIVIIDSAQYFFRGKKGQDFLNFVEKLSNTTFIWIVQTEKGKVRGAVASDIVFHSDIVIDVENFQATVYKNRFEAYEPRIINLDKYNERTEKLILKG